MDFKLCKEVAAALAEHRPVVALESTIIAHGFPAPDNLAVGRALEAAIRNRGGVPATIAVLDGVIRVGLDDDAMTRLAEGPFEKCSVRDLAVVAAAGGDGATTVAATLVIAAKAGIEVFATGGIGGVHRDADRTWDVSADLTELSRTPGAVVCAGAKSILDLPATLEMLETLGVPVLGYGVDNFPAFHARSSGLALKHRIDDVAAMAAAIKAHRQLGLPGAVLVCNPPPAEAALSHDVLEALVTAAQAEATAAGITGPSLTPFLLAALDRLSSGKTRIVNRALAIANAELGADLAGQLVTET